MMIPTPTSPRDHFNPGTATGIDHDTAARALSTETASALGGDVVSRSGLTAGVMAEGDLTARRIVTQPSFQFLTDTQIENLPPPEWLIDNVIQARAVSLLVGEPAVGKTFLALDWACSIAEGLPWCGHPSKRGCVVYVAAEGVEGMGTRLKAWKFEHGVTSCSGLQTVPSALPLLYDRQCAAQVDVFIEQAARHRPVLVVLDTLARCMVGGDEDSARDMGIAVAAADQIRDRLQCAVLILHHPTKRSSAKPVERGSGALKGAIATQMLLVRAGDHLSLVCAKQRHAADFAPVPLQLRVVNVGDGQTSCVIASYGQPTTTRDALAAGPRRSLEMLASCGGGEVSTGTWQKAAGHAESTHFSHQTTLKSRGYICQGPSGTGSWVITDKGRAVVSPTPTTPTPTRLQFDSHDESPMTPTPTPSTPLGVEEGEEGRVTTDDNGRSNESVIPSVRPSPAESRTSWWG